MGEVVAVDTANILDLIEQGRLPVVSSLAPDQAGQSLLNVNADAAAAALAVALGATKLVLLTNVPASMSIGRPPTP